MTKLTTLILGAGLALAAANSKTYTGVVTDTMCGKDHSAMGNMPAPQCVRECVKGGSKYALLVGNNVYTLSDQQKPEKFAGQKVKVTGTLDEKTKTLKVDSIEAAK